MSELSEKLRDYVFECVEIDDVSVPVVYDAEVLMEKAAYELEAQANLIEELREALGFYAAAWVDDFGFLASEPRGKEPSDALYDDEGSIACAALSKANPHSEKVE